MRAKRILGVTAMAGALGCGREHLARCLRGERKLSLALRLRYEALKALDAEIAGLASQPPNNTES